ncbi:unnamed protein product, partial [Symbiodinium sp. CCMP2592]
MAEEERALKRQKSLSDEGCEFQRRPQLTPEQQLLLEKKRQQALERRLQRQATPSQARTGPPTPAAAGAQPALSEEQLERIRLNREAALARKRLAAGCAPSTQVALESADVTSYHQPAPAPTEQPETGAGGIQDPSQCLSQDEKREDGLQMQDREGGESDNDSEMTSASSATAEPWLELSEPSEGDLSSSSSSSSSSDGSGSSSSEESEDDEIAEEAEEPDPEVQDHAEAGNPDADALPEDRDMDDECPEEELPEPRTAPTCTGEARPKSLVPCCTDRWPHVALQPITPAGGEVPAPRTGRDRNAKQKLVAKLLCRWWYVLPDWPPKDFDFETALAERGYRKVHVEAFELEPDADDAGLRKAFPVSGGFRGLYRNPEGCLIDVRPVAGRPSYDQLMLRTTQELHRLVVLAYTRQLEDLDAKPHLPETELEMRQQLRQELAE